LAAGAVDRGGALAGAEFQPALGVEALRPQPHQRRVGLAGEVGLRQRRALVG
jgi:hypothetical protein